MIMIATGGKGSPPTKSDNQKGSSEIAINDPKMVDPMISMKIMPVT
jgi:hypothetical protein